MPYAAVWLIPRVGATDNPAASFNPRNLAGFVNSKLKLHPNDSFR